MSTLNPEKRKATRNAWAAKNRGRLRALAKKYREAHPELVAERLRKYREREGETLKAKKRAAYHADIEKSHAVRRASHAKNKEKNNAACTEWYRENREKILAKLRQRYATSKEYREKVSRNGKNVRFKYGDRVRKKKWLDKYLSRPAGWNPNKKPIFGWKRCESCPRWFAVRWKNKKHASCSIECGQREYWKVADSKRKRRSAQCEGNITRPEWIAICEYFGWRCAYCHEYTPNPHLEHIVPVCQKGRNDASNIVPACESCNCRKWKKSLLQFMFLDPLKEKLKVRRGPKRNDTASAYPEPIKASAKQIRKNLRKDSSEPAENRLARSNPP